MILLSRLIKSNWTNHENAQEKLISIKYIASNLEEDLESQQVKQRLVENATNEANAIKQQAMEELERVRQQIHLEQQNWETEKVQLMEEANAQGFAKGMEQGKQAGYQDFLEHIQLSKSIVHSSKEDYQKYLYSAEKKILDLGIKIAEKILNKKIEEKEAYFFSLVKKVLKETRNQKEIQLHVNPIHYQYLLSEKEELLSLFPVQPNLFIFPDENLLQNDCMIETSTGRIDASVDTQLSMIKQKLLDFLESE